MSAADRWSRPQPKPLDQLSRPQVAARVQVLRTAMTLLVEQSDLDGGAVYQCTGSMRQALYHLEARLRELATEEPEPPMPLEVALAAVSATTRRIG